MEIHVNVIAGINVGFEFFQDEDFGNGFMLDLFFFRVLFVQTQD